MTDEEKDTLQELYKNLWTLPEDPKSEKKVPWPVTVMSRLKKIHEQLAQLILIGWLLVFEVALFAIRW